MVENIKGVFKTEKELRMSQIQLENALEMANLASWEFNLSNNKYLFNDRFYSMFGTSAELEGGYIMSAEDFFTKFIHPDDVQNISDSLNRSLETKESAFGTELEHRIIRGDGKTRYMVVRIRTIKSTENHDALAYGTIQDVTERKKIEDELKESEEKFRKIFYNANDAMFLFKLEGKYLGNFLEVNDLACESLGYTREELTCMGPRDIINPDNISRLTMNIENFFKEQKTTFETSHLTKDDKSLPVEINSHLFNVGGEKYILSIARDISERKKAEKALEETERNYRDLVDNSSVGVFKTNINGDIIFVNNAMVNIFHYDSVEDMMDYSIKELYRDQEDRLNLVHRLQKEYKVTDYQMETVGKNGETIDVLVSAILEGDTLSGMFMDVTARKKAEDALRKSENLYRTIFENTGAATIIYDKDGIITMMNSETENLSGYTRKEVEGRMNWMKFVHPDDIEMMIQYHKQREEDPELAPSQYETRFINRIGELIYAQITVDKIPGVQEYISSIVDITEQKKQNEDLKWELEVNQALNKLYTPLVSKQTSLEEIADTILFESLKLTESRMGFVGEIIPDTHGMVVLSMIPHMSNNEYKRPYLKLMGEGVYEGLMGYSLKIKEGFFTNNAPSHPAYVDSHGLEVEKFLSVPVILKDELVGQISISNSSRDYTEKDLEAILRLTHFYSMALQKVRDEKELKNSLAEKEVLLREIHHRVKNNMQIISSLLNLQIQFEDLDETVGVLKESQGRVKSMAIIHEKLYQSSSLTNINFKEYIEKLILDIFYSYGILKSSIESVLDIKDINLNIDTAIPLGLIINELVTNSVKYAFPELSGKIFVKLMSKNDQLELTIADNGIGIPEGVDLENSKTLGLQLVNSLVTQLEGELKRDLSNGTEFKIIFKELEYKNRI
jgi:PAS domain S-box-containing protein